jgi:hypothetical protein
MSEWRQRVSMARAAGAPWPIRCARSIAAPAGSVSVSPASGPGLRAVQDSRLDLPSTWLADAGSQLRQARSHAPSGRAPFLVRRRQVGCTAALTRPPPPDRGFSTPRSSAAPGPASQPAQAYPARGLIRSVRLDPPSRARSTVYGAASDHGPLGQPTRMEPEVLLQLGSAESAASPPG